MDKILSIPKFYDDLVYNFSKIVGDTNVSE